MDNLGNQLYTGSADFGKFMAFLSAIVSTLLFIGLLVGGIFVLRKKTIYTEKTFGVIKDASCSTSILNGNTNYVCNLLRFTFLIKQLFLYQSKNINK